MELISVGLLADCLQDLAPREAEPSISPSTPSDFVTSYEQVQWLPSDRCCVHGELTPDAGELRYLNLAPDRPVDPTCIPDLRARPAIAGTAQTV